MENSAPIAWLSCRIQRWTWHWLRRRIYWWMLGWTHTGCTNRLIRWSLWRIGCRFQRIELGKQDDLLVGRNQTWDRRWLDCRLQRRSPCWHSARQSRRHHCWRNSWLTCWLKCRNRKSGDHSDDLKAVKKVTQLAWRMASWRDWQKAGSSVGEGSAQEVQVP